MFPSILGKVRNLPAYPVYLVMAGASSMFFALVFTVNLVYQATVVNLNPLQLVLVGTVLETTAFLGEVPTGIVADVYSRRLSIVAGFVLVGLGFILEGSIPHFGAVLGAQVLWGLGATFMSGATEAWLADEIGEDRAGGAYLRAAQVGQLAGLVGTAASAGLGSLRINLPIVLGGAAMLSLAGFLALAMPERGFKPIPAADRSSWQRMASTLHGGIGAVRVRPALATILGIGAVYGMSSEGFDRLWTAHFLRDFTLPGLGHVQPAVWFALISGVGGLMSVAGNELIRRRVDTNSHRAVARTLSSVYALLVVGVVGFGLAGSFPLALLSFWACYLLRSMNGPLYTAWVNQRLDPQVRATVLSMSSQVDALGQIAGGPAIGYIGTAVSLRAALVTTGLVLSPALALYARLPGRQGSDVAENRNL